MSFYGKVNAVCLLAILVMGAALICLEAQGGTRIPVDQAQAHQYFDHVLYPLFIAKSNEFLLRHPTAAGHELTLDAGDVMRYRDLVDSFKELQKGARAMGY